MISLIKKYLLFMVIISMPLSSFGSSLPELLGLGKNKEPQSEKSVRSIRARTKKNKKPYQTIKTMSYAELEEQKNLLLSNAQQVSSLKESTNRRLIARRKVCKAHSDKRTQFSNKERAIKYVERMIPLCKNLDDAGTLMLELADLNFDCGNLEVAQKQYREFASLHPGDKRLHHALYHELLASFYQSLDAERDQEKTQDALTLAKTFLTQTSIDDSFHKEVLSIKKQCELKLFDYEVFVANFYLHRKSNASAYQRMTTAKNLYQTCIEQYPECQQQMAHLEERLIAQAPLYESIIKKRDAQTTVTAELTTDDTPEPKILPLNLSEIIE